MDCKYSKRAPASGASHPDTSSTNSTNIHSERAAPKIEGVAELCLLLLAAHDEEYARAVHIDPARGGRARRCPTALSSIYRAEQYKYSTALYSTVQYSTVQYSTVQYSNYENDNIMHHICF